MTTLIIDSIVVEIELEHGGYLCQSYFYDLTLNSEYTHVFQMRFPNQETIETFCKTNNIKLEWSLM